MNITFEKFLIKLVDILETPLFSVGETEWSINSIFKLTISLIVVIILGRALKKLLKEVVLVRLKIEPATIETLATVLSYGGCTFIVLIVLDSQGFNVASLAVLAGGLGVGIGWGLQDITKNFISGITLLVEKPMKIGDLVELDGTYAFVEEISLRSTRVRTVQGSHLVIPNGFLVGEKLHNLTYDNPKGRVEIEVVVPYNSDRVLATEVILMSAYMEAGVLKEPPPRVLFMGVEDSVLKFELWAWVEPITLFPYYMASLRSTILHNLTLHGIEVPVPYRNLRVVNPEVFGKQSSFPEAVRLEEENKLQIIEFSRHSPEEDKNQLLPKPPSKPLSARHLLLHVSYFQHLTDLELHKLIEVGYRKTVKTSEFLFREGEPGDAFYIILSGSIKIFVEKIDKHLNTLKAGDFFGELALMLGIPRTATAMAVEDTVLFGINKTGFEKLLQENRELANDIMEELGKHQQELSERKKQLKEMGLIEEDEESIEEWMRHRLQHLFHLKDRH